MYSKWPLQPGTNGNIVKVDYYKSIEQSIQEILAIGFKEMFGNESRGSLIQMHLFNPVDIILESLIYDEVRNRIVQQERRVTFIDAIIDVIDEFIVKVNVVIRINASGNTETIEQILNRDGSN